MPNEHTNQAITREDGQSLGYADRDDPGRAQRLLAICGMVAPILFAGLVIVLGLLEPGYSHRTRTMSVLGGVGGLRGITFNVGGALTGLLLIAFAIGLHRGIGEGRGSKVGPFLIVLSGFGMVGSAIFHCDLGCANVSSRTPTGILHIVSAGLSGAPLAISLFIVFLRLRKDQRWENYRRFTLAMGILGNTPGVVLWITFFTTRITAWEGLIQRLGIAFPLILFVF